MVGMAPSVLMRGEFFDIPSPFATIAENAGGRRRKPLIE
jgi:hypothetical protein